MKKISAIFMLILLLVSVFALPASAGDKKHTNVTQIETRCTVNGEFESLTYADKTYLPIDLGNAFVYGDDWRSLNTSFSDKSIAQLFSSVELWYYAESDYVIIAHLTTATGWSATKYFVEQSVFEEVNRFLSGERIGSYLTQSHFGEEYEFMDGQISDWQNGKSEVINGIQLGQCERYPLYITDKYGGVRMEVGSVCRKYDNDSDTHSQTYYLMSYKDNDHINFHDDGGFTLDWGVEVTLYVLEDEALASELGIFYDSTPSDDLDWVVGEEKSDGAVITFLVIVFGVIPLGIVLLSLFFLFIKRPRKVHRNCLIVFVVTSAVVIACLVAVLVQLHIGGAL